MRRWAVRRVTLVLVGSLLLALWPGLVSQLAPVAHAATERPVMAFYYPWYELSDWSYAQMSDLAAPKYSGGADATIRRHIQQADDAGIDALICTWYGPGEPRLNQRCRRLLQLVQESGRRLRVALIPDQSAAFDPAMRTVDGLASALAVVRQDFMSSPAYFTFRGKPVLFWFNPPSLGDVGAWQQLRGRADPNRAQFWFGGTDNFGYMAAFDTLYYYDISWEGSPGAAMASYAGRLASYNSSHGEQRPFAGTVMPGYDDLRVRPDGHRQDRANGDYYRGTWQTVIDRNADAVVLTSFNEFFEGSYIEPSERFGDLYLRLTREGSDRYHNNQPPGSCRTFPETNRQVCGAFLAYYDQHGGLPINGLPLSGEFREKLGDGNEYTVQYFERVRMEYHGNNPDPYKVMLGQFGRRVLQETTGREADPPVAQLPGAAYDPITQHNFDPRFLGYWQQQGGLDQFGRPLTETFRQVLENGQEYEVQYFERARFEWHPEVGGGQGGVLLGQFGRRVCGDRCR